MFMDLASIVASVEPQLFFVVCSSIKLLWTASCCSVVPIVWSKSNFFLSEASTGGDFKHITQTCKMTECSEMPHPLLFYTAQTLVNSGLKPLLKFVSSNFRHPPFRAVLSFLELHYLVHITPSKTHPFLPMASNRPGRVLCSTCSCFCTTR